MRTWVRYFPSDPPHRWTTRAGDVLLRLAMCRSGHPSDWWMEVLP